MNASHGHALEQALAYFRAPGMLPLARERPLPDDVLDVLKLAAGDEALAAESAAASGETEATVVEASKFFIQQVLFAPDADSYRVLGVNPDAPEARLKENYRWLVRWLHPDRNQDDWNSVYADRVTRAWQDLRRGAKTPAVMPVATAQAGVFASPVPSLRRIEVDPVTPLISSRTAQRLPIIVLGGLGFLAVLVLVMMWFLQRPRFVEDPAGDWPAAAATVAPADIESAEPLDVAVVTAPATVPQADAAEMAAPPVAKSVVASAPTAAVAQQPKLELAQAPAAALRSPPSAEARARPSPEPAVAASVRPDAPRSVQVAAAAPPAAVVAPEAPVASPRREAVDAPVATVTPTPTLEQAEPAPVRPAAADIGSARQVLSRFSQAYAAGDINALMRLFTRDARNNRGDRDAITYDYQSLFSSSSKRELALDLDRWVERDGGATVVANYTAKVKPNGSFRTNVSRGQLRFELRSEGTQLKITRILLQDGG